MNLVYSSPAAFTPLSHANLHAALSTSSLSSLASNHSLTSNASTSSASAALSPALLNRNFTLEQIVAAAQLQNHLHAFQLPIKAEMSAMLPSSIASSLGGSMSHSSSSSSPPSSTVSVASSPSSPAGKSSSSSSSPPSGSDVHKRIRATKNKQKHNESESRRRDRLRTQFNALRNASECDKKDRIAILAAATERLKQQDARVRQYEAERELLIQQLNQANQQLNRAQLAVAAATSASAGQGGVSLLGKDGNAGDVGKLAAGQVGWLASLPCAFVGLDGKFLDVNAAFVALTGHAIEFILSSTIFVLTPQHELTPTFMQLKRLLAGEIESWESDRSCLTADGSALPVHMTMTVAKSREGKPDFFTLFFVSKADNGANGLSVFTGGQQQQQQQQQSTLQLPQPTVLRPPTSGGMSLFSLPTTTNLSLLTSQQQSSLPGHPHVSPLSHQHLGAGGLGLATLQHSMSQQQQQQQHQQQQQQQQQHRFDTFQPTYTMQQHM